MLLYCFLYQALKTLKLFPLPLESGKDCKLLRSFGDKICKMLDEKLAQYIKDGGNCLRLSYVQMYNLSLQ